MDHQPMIILKKIYRVQEERRICVKRKSLKELFLSLTQETFRFTGAETLLRIFSQNGCFRGFLNL
jgi:hypothetical protein